MMHLSGLWQHSLACKRLWAFSTMYCLYSQAERVMSASAFSMARGWQFLFTKNTCENLSVVDEVTKTGKEHIFLRPNGAAKTPLPLPYALLPKVHATNLWCQSSTLNQTGDLKELAVIKIWLKMYELWQSNKFSKHGKDTKRCQSDQGSKDYCDTKPLTSC